MSMGQGLAFLATQREKAGWGNESGDRMNQLWVRGGERAQFWFLSDGQDMQVPLMHQVPMPPSKRTGKAWKKDVLCAKAHYDDETDCELCNNPANAQGKVDGPWLRLVCYVYVSNIWHPDRRGNGSDQWEGVRNATTGQTVYKEVVNDARLLLAKPKLQSQILTAFAGDPTDPDFETRVPTLLDRPWQLTRGTGSTDSEELKEGKPAEMPAEVAAALAALRPLTEQIEAQFVDRKRGGGATRSGGAASVTPAVSADGPGFDPTAGGAYQPGDDDLEDLEGF